jgi:hypothetical protein
MKLIRAIFLISIFLIHSSIWAQNTTQSPTVEIQNICIVDNKNETLLVKRGCCSHHQGVCGCSGGRAACCDGSLSPSCGCNSDSIKDELNPTKTKG